MLTFPGGDSFRQCNGYKPVALLPAEGVCLSQAVSKTSDSLRFSGSASHSQPKPRTGARQIRNAIALGTAFIGGLVSQHCSARLLTPEAMAIVQPTSMEVRKNFVNMAAGLYLQLMALSLATMPLFRRQDMMEKTLKPSELFAPLHQQGLRGEGMKIGVVDVGFQHSLSPFSKQWDRKIDTPNDPDELLYLDLFNLIDSHGTHVSNIIADALPKGKILTATAFVKLRDGLRDGQYNISHSFIKTHLKNPGGITFTDVLKTSPHRLECVSRKLEQCIEHGADVINVSLGWDRDKLTDELVDIIHRIGNIQLISQLRDCFEGDCDYIAMEFGFQNTQQFRAHLRLLKERLLGMVTQLDGMPVPQEGMDAVLKPWKAALDKAAAQNIPVVLSAGNNGPRTRKYQPGTVGSVNLLAWNQHPALFVVGSCNLDGGANLFSAEGDDLRTPLISTVGSGEIETQVPEEIFDKIRRRFHLLDLVCPPRAFINAMLSSRIPDGTSFSAPIVSAALAAIKQANPDIRLDQIRQCLTTTANAAHLSEPLKKWVTKRQFQIELLAAVEPVLQERLVGYRENTWQQHGRVGLSVKGLSQEERHTLESNLGNTSWFNTFSTEMQPYPCLTMNVTQPITDQNADEVKLVLAKALIQTPTGCSLIDLNAIESRIQNDLADACRRFNGAGQLNLAAAVDAAKDLAKLP